MSFGHLSLLALGVASPFERERGRVRVSCWNSIDVLDNNPSPSSSPLEQGERRQKTDAMRDS